MEKADYNKVSSIVDQMCLKKGLSSGHWFPWLLSMGLWHLRELKLDTWQDLKTELFDVTDRKTVTMRQGYVDWVKVGIQYGQYVLTLGINGELNTLNRNENQISPVSGLASQNLPNGLNFENYNGIGYTFSNYEGRSFNAIGPGLLSKGHFKVNRIGSLYEILLDYDVTASQLYVEYITDGFDPCGETVLNPYFADFFLKAMEFAYEEEKNPSRTEASIRRKGIELNDARKVVRARRNDLSPQTMLNMSRSAVRFTAKV